MTTQQMQAEVNDLWYYVRNYSFDQLMDKAMPHVRKICYYFVNKYGDDEGAKHVTKLICTPLYIDRQITLNETKAFKKLFASMAKFDDRFLASYISAYATINKMDFYNYFNTLPTEVRYHVAYVVACLLGTDSDLEFSEYEIVSELTYRIF